MAKQSSSAPARVPIGDTLGFRLARLTRFLRSSWTQTLEPLTLSPPEAAILRAVGDQPGIGVRALARYLNFDPMNVKRSVDALQGRGILTNTQSTIDSRSRALALSEEGAILVSRVDDLAAKQSDIIMSVVPFHARQEFLDAIASLENLFVFSGRPIPGEENQTPNN